MIQTKYVRCIRIQGIDVVVVVVMVNIEWLPSGGSQL